MKLSTFKNHLEQLTELNFIQPNGYFVPRHFHITEAGLTTKHFMDCGGTVRTEKTISLQIWVAQDYEHRLTPKKLSGILKTAAPLFENEDLEIEVEYQLETVSRFGLNFNGNNFQMLVKKTDCLAKDTCGVPQEKTHKPLSELTPQNSSCCTPGGGCC